MAENVNTLKRCLKNTSMHINHVRGGTLKKFFVYELKLRNFFQLKDNIEYSVEFFHMKLIVSIIKKRRFISVALMTEYHSEISECYVDYGAAGFSIPVQIERKTQVLYETEVPSNVFNNSRNMLLKTGILGLIFRCKPVWELVDKMRPLMGCKNYSRNYATISRSSYPTTKSHESDQKKLSRNLRDYFWSKPNWDFVIYSSNGIPFRVRKAILAARSTFFLDYINENKETDFIKLPDVTHYALNIVLQYIYHGEIETFEVRKMLEVLELAVRLKIQSLEKLCLLYMKDKINPNTAGEIRRMGKKLGLEVLVEECDEVLSREEKPPPYSLK